jgi:hypothetical protein
MDNAWKRSWPFPLWRLHSDHSHRSADQCPETPPEHQELSVADALRTSVVTGNYLQINSPWPPARTRGFPLYSHRCCLGHLAAPPASAAFFFGRRLDEYRGMHFSHCDEGTICGRPAHDHWTISASSRQHRPLFACILAPFRRVYDALFF